MDRAKVCVLFLTLLVLEPCNSLVNVTSDPSTDQQATDFQSLKSQLDQLTESLFQERGERARLQGELIQLTVNLTEEVIAEQKHRIRLEEELALFRSGSTVEISQERDHRLRLEKELIRVETEFTAEIAAAREHREHLEEQLGTSNRSKQQEQVVAFSAWVTHDIEHEHAKQVIVFGTVVTNVGNAYNNGTGQFHCPVAGVYQFYAAIESKPSQFIHSQLMVNGEPRLYLYSSGDKDSSGSVGSNTIILELGQGDVVWVQLQSSNGGFIDGGFSTFSGHLLHAM